MNKNPYFAKSYESMEEKAPNHNSEFGFEKTAPIY